MTIAFFYLNAEGHFDYVGVKRHQQSNKCFKLKKIFINFKHIKNILKTNTTRPAYVSTNNHVHELLRESNPIFSDNIEESKFQSASSDDICNEPWISSLHFEDSYFPHNMFNGKYTVGKDYVENM